ncbi:MAG: hemolysin family protein [Phycisphaerae bacterium]
METWVFWGEWLIIFFMMLSATLNLALRVPSRARFAAQLKKLGKADMLEAFALRRPQYVVATAVIRAATKVLLLAFVLYSQGLFRGEASLIDVAIVCAEAWGLILIFAIAIPTAWAKYSGDWLVARLMPVLRLMGAACQPITVLLGLFDPFIRRLAGVPKRDAKSYADELEQQILDVVREGERHGAVDEEEKEMIESVIELSETHVEEIMTPRTEVVALPQDATLEEVLKTIQTHGHSRIPVFAETIDEILGVLYAKDLLHRPKEPAFHLTETTRDALFIPESKLVRELLREFQTKKVHIAIVLDEYGGTAGIVTIEDILEELVGEIVDEYEPDEPDEFQRIDERTVEVDARMRIDELNDELNIELPEDGDYETIGGFVFAKLGKIPSAGETCTHENINIHVVAAETRRITRLRISLPREDSIPSAD